MNYSHGNDEPRRTMEQTRETLKQRAARARDVVENVREKAEDVIRDKPYLVPIAAGALGLGVGLLLGSKLTRFIVFTAVGTFVAETFGPEIRRLSRQLASEVQKNLGEGNIRVGEEGLDEGETGGL
jgi:hypothetical protein